VKDAEWLPGSPEAISESYVFVSAMEAGTKGVVFVDLL